MSSNLPLHDLLVATGTISVGDHAVQWRIAGLTFNIDTIYATVLAGVIVCGIGWLIARGAKSGVPTKSQYMAEWLYNQTSGIASSAIGEAATKFVPLGLTLFVFILTCNWIGVIPSGHNPEWLASPTSDINLPLALMCVVIPYVHVQSIKARGGLGYIKHYFQPWYLFPINVIEEITKPITLTFRLFGNVFAGGLMVSVMVALLPFFTWAPFEFGWKLFDMFIGAIQAFIFALLTIIYLGMAMDTHNHEEELHLEHQLAAAH